MHSMIYPKALLVSSDGCHSRYKKSLACPLEDQEGDGGWGKGQTQNSRGGSCARGAYSPPRLCWAPQGHSSQECGELQTAHGSQLLSFPKFCELLDILVF